MALFSKPSYLFDPDKYPAKTNHSDTLYQEAFAELAAGLVARDKEWAIQQLTELELKGRKVADLKIHEIKLPEPNPEPEQEV